jgi:hypothetical protein
MTFATLVWVGTFWLSLLLVVGWSIRMGGGPERAVAIVFLVGGIFSRVAIAHPHKFDHVEVGLAVIDLGVLIGSWLISMYANRWWPLPLTATQVVACLAHVCRAADATVSPASYSRMEAFSAWPMVILLIAGTLAHRRRSRAIGVDPSWSKSLPMAVRRILVRLRLG